jgi:hypothetical protein
MKPSEVYTRAAELIARGKEIYGCYAISKVANNNYWSSEESRKFMEYFIPEEKERKSVFWFGGKSKENQRARVLALYLMAEIAKELE